MAEKNDLTFVDSVNICLSAIGEQPTTGDTSGKVTVNTDTNRIVQITSDLLKEVTIDVENRGWDFQATTGTVEGIDITTNKYDWNGLHTVSFKRYVTIRAARILQARYVTDENLHTFSAAEEAFSYANLQQVDATARLAAQFKLPDSITNLGIEKTDFLAGTVEEKLGYLRMATEVNNTQLVNAQKLRVDEETDLLQQQFLTEQKETEKRSAESGLTNQQQGLIGEQTITEAANRSKLNAEKSLIDQQRETEAKQTDKVEAETDLIAEQEDLIVQQQATEVQETEKRSAETGLVHGQLGLVGEQTITETVNRTKVDSERKRIDEETDLLQEQHNTQIEETAKRSAETGLVQGQLGLVSEQTLSEIKNRELTDAQKVKTNTESELIEDQKTKLAADTGLVAQQSTLVSEQVTSEAINRAKVTKETEVLLEQQQLIDEQGKTQQQETIKKAAETGLVAQQSTLTVEQANKTSKESLLVASQKSLVDAQKNTELQEKAKREAEVKQVESQTLQVDAQTGLAGQQTILTSEQAQTQATQRSLLSAQAAQITAQRNTETRTQRKLEEETDLLEAQESRITGETAYMITAENDYIAILKGTGILTSNVFYDQRFNPLYNNKKHSFRMMGIKEADFNAAPAYKKLSMLEEADAFSQSQLTGTSSVSIPYTRTGGYGHWVFEMYQKLGYGKAENSNDDTITRWLYDSYLNNLYTLGERKLSWTRRTIKLTADSNGRLKAPLSSGFVIGGGRTYSSYTYYRINGKQLGYEPHTEGGEDYNILVDLDLDENQSTSFNGEYTVEVGQTMDSHQSNGIAPLFENWVQTYTLLQFVETYPVNATEVDKFRKEEARFRSLMEQEEAELGQYNILDSTDVAQRVGHNRNYNLL